MLWSPGSVFKWVIVCSSLMKGICIWLRKWKRVFRNMNYEYSRNPKRIVMILLVLKMIVAGGGYFMAFLQGLKSLARRNKNSSIHFYWILDFFKSLSNVGLGSGKHTLNALVCAFQKSCFVLKNIFTFAFLFTYFYPCWCIVYESKSDSKRRNSSLDVWNTTLFFVRSQVRILARL